MALTIAMVPGGGQIVRTAAVAEPCPFSERNRSKAYRFFSPISRSSAQAFSRNSFPRSRRTRSVKDSSDAVKESRMRHFAVQKARVHAGGFRKHR